MTKPIKPQGQLLETINHLERRKTYMTSSPNMESKIIAISNSRDKDNPEYFIRADYFKSKDEPQSAQEYWQITNIETPYFTDRRKQLDNFKELIEMQKSKGNDPLSNKLKMKEMLTRYNFLVETRHISNDEMQDRMEHEYILFLKRD